METWTYVSKPGAYEGDLHYRNAGTGSGTATYTPEIAVGEDGDYKVYAWWTQHSNRASNAPYTIYYDGGSERIEVDQRINGSQWNQLGTPGTTYPFVAGTSGYVVLSDDADGQLIADAIKLEKQ